MDRKDNNNAIELTDERGAGKYWPQIERVCERLPA